MQHPSAALFLTQQGQNRLDLKREEECFLQVSRLTDGAGVFHFAGRGNELLIFGFTLFLEVTPLSFITGSLFLKKEYGVGVLVRVGVGESIRDDKGDVVGRYSGDIEIVK